MYIPPPRGATGVLKTGYRCHENQVNFVVDVFKKLTSERQEILWLLCQGIPMDSLKVYVMQLEAPELFYGDGMMTAVAKHVILSGAIVEKDQSNIAQTRYKGFEPDIWSQLPY